MTSATVSQSKPTLRDRGHKPRNGDREPDVTPRFGISRRTRGCANACVQPPRRGVPGVLGERMLGGGDKGAAGALVLIQMDDGLGVAVRSKPMTSGLEFNAS